MYKSIKSVAPMLSQAATKPDSHWCLLPPPDLGAVSIRATSDFHFAYHAESFSCKYEYCPLLDIKKNGEQMDA